MIKHFFFDLDKTLTKSRSEMDPEHRSIFRKLCDERDVIVVTGGTVQHIREQVTSEFDGSYIALAQSGNHALDSDGAELWYEPLSDLQVAAIYESIAVIRTAFDDEILDQNDLIESRGAQIGYSVIGYHAPVEKKYAFDPGDTRRQEALGKHAAEVMKLKVLGIEITPAGTTSFNFLALGKHKGFNIARLNALKNWTADECMYVGDALFPGGNDETVIGVIPTHPVDSPDATFTFINQVIS